MLDSKVVVEIASLWCFLQCSKQAKQNSPLPNFSNEVLYQQYEEQVILESQIAIFSSDNKLTTSIFLKWQ